MMSDTKWYRAVAASGANLSLSAVTVSPGIMTRSTLICLCLKIQKCAQSQPHLQIRGGSQIQVAAPQSVSQANFVFVLDCSIYLHSSSSIIVRSRPLLNSSGCKLSNLTQITQKRLCPRSKSFLFLVGEVIVLQTFSHRWFQNYLRPWNPFGKHSDGNNGPAGPFWGEVGLEILIGQPPGME